jgi:hypothetical protein
MLTNYESLEVDVENRSCVPKKCGERIPTDLLGDGVLQCGVKEELNVCFISFCGIFFLYIF